MRGGEVREGLKEGATITRGLTFILAVACATIVANLYYAQNIVV